MTSTVIDALTALDFDYAPPCEANGKRVNIFGETYFSDENLICNGNNVAEWRLVSCCGETKLYCSHCLDYKLNLDYLVCLLCLTKHKPPENAYVLRERL